MVWTCQFHFIDENGNRIYYVDPFELKPPNSGESRFGVYYPRPPRPFFSSGPGKNFNQHYAGYCAAGYSQQIDIDEDLKFAVEPNKSYEIKNFRFQTIPAYNNRPEALQFHPKANHWVGYIFELNGRKFITPATRILSTK